MTHQIDVWRSLYRLTNVSCIITSSLCRTAIHGRLPSFHPWNSSTCPRLCPSDIGGLANAHMNVAVQNSALQASAQNFLIALHHTWKTTESLIVYHASNSSLLPVELNNSFSRKASILDGPGLPLAMSAGGSQA